ncbi:MAG TPA: hypothetical protein VIW02_00845, partial [Gammaproteobacteria bacterium]
RIEQIYTRQALEVFAGSWKFTLPPGTGLPGDSEYLAELDRHLTAAARDEISAAEAMRLTAAGWEQITERYGRAQQAAHWRAFQGNFRLAP